MFRRKVFLYKDLEDLTAKEEAQLLRIFLGKDSSKFLNKKEMERAVEILSMKLKDS